MGMSGNLHGRIPMAGGEDCAELYICTREALLTTFAPDVETVTHDIGSSLQTVYLLEIWSADTKFTIQALECAVFSRTKQRGSWLYSSVNDVMDLEQYTSPVYLETVGKAGDHLVELLPDKCRDDILTVRGYDLLRPPRESNINLLKYDVKSLLASLHRVVQDPMVDFQF